MLKKLTLAETFAILLPFKSINFEIGLTLYAFQIPILFLMVYRFFSFKKKLKFDKYFVLFLIYVFISTIFISNFYIDNFEKNQSNLNFFRNEGRYISVLFKIIFIDYGLFFAIINLDSNYLAKIGLIRKYIYSLIALSILGLIQVVISIILNVDIFPNVYIGHELGVVDVVDAFKDFLPFSRLTSLGAEPKNIACSLAVGVGILVLSKYPILTPKKKIISIFLFIVCIFFTLSTSGLGLLLLIMLFFIVLNIKSLPFFIKSPKTIIIFIFCMCLILYFYDFIIIVFESRILERSEELLNEDVDKYIQLFLLKNPNWLIFGSGSGNIHNLVMPYLEDGVFFHSGGEIFNSRYGYMKLISENGVIGLILYSIIFVTIFHKLWKSKLHRSFSHVLFLLFLFYLIRGDYVLYELLFIASIGISLLNDGDFHKKISTL